MVRCRLAIGILVSLVGIGMGSMARAQWTPYSISDCSGGDTGCTAGALPDPSRCHGGTVGTVAVCWDGITLINGMGCGSSAWCTYKSVSTTSCTGGVAPGQVYECRNTPTPTITETPTVTPTQTPTETGTVTSTPTPTATFAAGCPATPASCASADKNILKIKTSSDPTKEKFLWKWGKGVLAAAQADFGDAVNGVSSYKMCVYDHTAGAPVFAMGASILSGGTCDAAPCWKALSDKGWGYKNVAGNSDGITKVTFKGGAAGAPSLKVSGKGASLSLPSPISSSEFFDQDTAVTIQLHSSTHCWSSSFTASGNKKNDGEQFKSKNP